MPLDIPEPKMEFILPKNEIVESNTKESHLISSAIDEEKQEVMDRFILKEVTEGKLLHRSLVFHIEDTLSNKHYETCMNRVNSKTFNLR